jgi:hypothetical protein
MGHPRAMNKNVAEVIGNRLRRHRERTLNVLTRMEKLVGRAHAQQDAVWQQRPANLSERRATWIQPKERTFVQCLNDTMETQAIFGRRLFLLSGYGYGSRSGCRLGWTSLSCEIADRRQKKHTYALNPDHIMKKQRADYRYLHPLSRYGCWSGKGAELGQTSQLRECAWIKWKARMESLLLTHLTRMWPVAYQYRRLFSRYWRCSASESRTGVVFPATWFGRNKTWCGYPCTAPDSPDDNATGAVSISWLVLEIWLLQVGGYFEPKTCWLVMWHNKCKQQ